MRLNKNIQILLFLLIGLILFYSYYYLPSQNKGFIKVEDIEKGPSTEKSEVKNTFTNTEYKNQDEKGGSTQLKLWNLIFIKIRQI